MRKYKIKYEDYDWFLIFGTAEELIDEYPIRSEYDFKKHSWNICRLDLKKINLLEYMFYAGGHGESLYLHNIKLLKNAEMIKYDSGLWKLLLTNYIKISNIIEIKQKLKNENN